MGSAARQTQSPQGHFLSVATVCGLRRMVTSWLSPDEILGLWIADNEGAEFWLSVMHELRSRGVQDIPTSIVDGPKGVCYRAMKSCAASCMLTSALKKTYRAGCTNPTMADGRMP